MPRAIIAGAFAISLAGLASLAGAGAKVKITSKRRKRATLRIIHVL